MYVWFQQPLDADGKLKTVSGRLGMLIARAAIGPASPALPNCEWTSFGVWKNASGELSITVPQGTGNFAHLCGKAVRNTVEDEDGNKTITMAPSNVGKAEVVKLTDAIKATFVAHVVTMDWGKRIEMAPFNPAPGKAEDIAATTVAATTPTPPMAVSASAAPPKPTQGTTKAA